MEDKVTIWITLGASYVMKTSPMQLAVSCRGGQGVLVVWRQEHRLQSKGNGMARDHLQGSGKKSDTPLTINTARLIMYDIVYVCVHVYV